MQLSALPYLIEGLDCSGKKTIASRISTELSRQGLDVDLVIGPLVKGPLGRLDARLANLTRSVPANSPLGTVRRVVYAIEPVADRVFYRPGTGPNVVIKISSHYRAWARAMVTEDGAMHRFYRATANLHPRFAGATLLSTDFDERVCRHREDADAGHTTKQEQIRFRGGAARFTAWHNTLRGLLDRHVDQLQILDTTSGDTEQATQKVIAHILACRTETR